MQGPRLGDTDDQDGGSLGQEGAAARARGMHESEEREGNGGRRGKVGGDPELRGGRVFGMRMRMTHMGDSTSKT